MISTEPLMIQSSSAQNRPLNDWYTQIRLGQIKLPRFQRMEAWDRNRIISFLNTILQNLPIGVTLVLEVGDNEKFVSRYIETTNPSNPERVTQHLLDGQQRLTAFWRSVHNNYEYETYFVYIPEFDDYRETPWSDSLEVYCRTRYMRNNKKYPIWPDNPSDCIIRGLIPTNLLNPQTGEQQTDEWVSKAIEPRKPEQTDANYAQAIEEFHTFKEKIKKRITKLRETMAYFNLPYLSLPVHTPKDVALQVFINMNTNSKPLTLFDIVVAEVEAIRGESLHKLIEELKEGSPQIKRYGELSGLVLTTSALLQGRLPNNRGALEMDKAKMLEKWDILVNCLDKMAKFLEGQRIFDKQRLPTNAVLSVIAALYEFIPDHGDQRGVLETLLKRYLWTAFFTDRYETATATKAFADFNALRRVMEEYPNSTQVMDTISERIPIFNKEEYPLPEPEELITAGWPKRENVRARAILSASLYMGGFDFADGQRATVDTVLQREYHHIFPDSLINGSGIDSYKALNCALVTWKTNRTIGNKEPLQYLKDRNEWVDDQTVKQRLHSHLIPLEELATGGYHNLSEEERIQKIRSDYDTFLQSRANMVAKTAKLLCSGKEVDVSTVINEE